MKLHKKTWCNTNCATLRQNYIQFYKFHATLCAVSVQSKRRARRVRLSDSSLGAWPVRRGKGSGVVRKAKRAPSAGSRNYARVLNAFGHASPRGRRPFFLSPFFLFFPDPFSIRSPPFSLLLLLLLSFSPSFITINAIANNEALLRSLCSSEFLFPFETRLRLRVSWRMKTDRKASPAIIRLNFSLRIRITVT